MNNINDFSVGGRKSKSSRRPQPLSRPCTIIRSDASAPPAQGEETFDAVKMLKAADPLKYRAAPGADYPKG